MIAWEMVSGEFPFASETPDYTLALRIVKRDPPNNTPLFWCGLIRLCWHRDPTQRPNCQELRENLIL